MEDIRVRDGEQIAQDHRSHIGDVPSGESPGKECVQGEEHQVAEDRVPGAYKDEFNLYVMLCQEVGEG